MKYTERDATKADVGYIFNNLREDDLGEALASGDSAKEVLMESYRSSTECYVMCADEVPFCIYGVVKDTYNEGVPWMMGTDELRAHKVFFMRTIKKIVADWLHFYKRLYNIVWDKNSMHIDWLEHMGFNIGGIVMYRGNAFRSFELCVQSQP